MCNSIEEDANKLKSEDQFSAKKDAHRPSAALLFDPSTPSENKQIVDWKRKKCGF